MAKKKTIPVIKRSVGKDKRVRFFKNGKPLSNKNNEASRAFVNQDFRRLVSSPTAQATLTPFEKLVLRNKQNALKGRDIISEKAQKSSAKRYRIKGRVVSKDVQNTIEFNPKLKALFQDKNLNNEPQLKNVQTSKEALEILSDLIDTKLTNQIQVIIDNDDWINFDRFRPEGTFSRPIEVLDLIKEINMMIPSTKPPTQLKVITRNGDELIGKEAFAALDEFIVKITDANRSAEGVAALFFFPYKYISPFFIVNLRDFDEEDDDNFVIQTSEMPRIKQSA
jgi:hypothetical protein